MPGNNTPCHLACHSLGLWAAVLTHPKQAEQGGSDHRINYSCKPSGGVLGHLLVTKPGPPTLVSEAHKQSFFWAAKANGAVPAAHHVPSALYHLRHGYRLQIKKKQTKKHFL